MDMKELLTRFYARERDVLFNNMHPDYRCHTPGNSQISGTFHGKDGMIAHIQQMQQLTGQTFRPHHLGTFLADGEWGLVPVHLNADRNGKRLDQPAFGVWRFKDGLVIEHWENPTAMTAFDNFWA